MNNKIFYIFLAILMISCDWGIIKDKSKEISELLRKDKDKTKNQNKIESNKYNTVSRNNISTDNMDIISLRSLNKVDLINNSQQVNEPVISNEATIVPQTKTKVDLINKINLAKIKQKPAQNLENSLSTTILADSVKFLPTNNQKGLIKKTLPNKLEDLENFLETHHEKVAYKKAKATQNLISSSNIDKEIVKFREKYSKLYNLFGDMQEKFHSQRNLFIRNTKFGENREKNTVIFKAFSSIEKKIKNLNYKLSEIQSNFQIANNSWNNANSLLKESIERLIQAIKKRHDNESRQQDQISELTNKWDKNQADNFAKDAKYKAEHSANDLENAASYFQYSYSNGKEAENLLEEIKKRFLRIGITYR